MVKKNVKINRVKRAEQQNNITPLLVSAAAGALVGAILSSYVPHKKTRTLGSSLSSKYNRFADQASDYIEKKSSNKMLWLGAIAGGVIGLTAITLLSDKHKGKKRHGLVDTFKDAGHAAVEGFQSINWADIAENVADSVVDKLQEGNDEVEEDDEEELEEGPSNKIQSIVDWAILGLNVWQNIKKGR